MGYYLFILAMILVVAWIIPIIDRLSRVNMTEQMLDAGPQEITTNDNLNARTTLCNISGMLTFKSATAAETVTDGVKRAKIKEAEASFEKKANLLFPPNPII